MRSVVQAWHAGYRGLDFGRFEGLRAVLDARGVLEPAAVEGAGVRYVGIGDEGRRACYPEG